MPLSIAEINPEVLVSLGEVTLVDDPFVQFLKARGEHTVNRRIRLCAHPGADDPLHEMMIVLFGSSYIPPHAHRGKSESFHMIEGAADVILFTADGTPEQALHLSEIRGGGHFYYRLGSDRFHTIIPRTSCVVFHETTNGPFRRQDTINAPWAPEQQAAEAEVLDYMNRLRQFAVRYHER